MSRNQDHPGVAGPIRAMEYKRMRPAELLRAARVYVARSWCQGSNALNASGLPVSPMSPEACQWCWRGAAIRVLEPSQSVMSVDLHNEKSKLSLYIAHTFGFKTSARMVQWNDTQHRTQEEVLQRIDELIALNEGCDEPPEILEDPDRDAEEKDAGDNPFGAKPAAPSVGRGRNRPSIGRKRTVQGSD